LAIQSAPILNENFCSILQRHYSQLRDELSKLKAPVSADDAVEPASETSEQSVSPVTDSDNSASVSVPIDAISVTMSMPGSICDDSGSNSAYKQTDDDNLPAVV
jgi:hypothetical protein